MAGGLLEYSGLVTKTRAMRGRLLSNRIFAELAECEKVDDILGFLREYESYAPIYRSHEEIAHRAQVEAAIHDSLYADYGKLYRFAGRIQRQGLALVFLRYEMNVLKTCMERIGRGQETNLAHLHLFFGAHAGFDVEAVTQARNMEEFLRALLGSRYEKLFERLLRDETMSQTARMVQMDLFYYETVWKCKNQLKDAAMRTICTQLFGTEIDWQNIMWLYRAKRFYHQKGEEILCDLIPVSYRLGMKEKRALAESETMEAFAQILENTAYFKGKDALAAIGDEVTFPQIMEKIYGRLCKKYPMSLAPVFKYLYDKEQEIDKLTTILEGVRYQIPARELQELVLFGS